MKEKKISFIGGDMRQMAAAQRVAELGYEVSVWGIPGEVRGDVRCLEKLSLAYEADVLVLPLPMSGDGVTVNCAGNFRDSAPRISEIFDSAKDIPLCAGRISPKIKDEAQKKGVRIFDYFE